MRRFLLVAMLAVSAALGSLMTSPAEAGHRYSRLGYGDPYAYRYEPRGYYPYYNSGYWRPAYVMRQRGRARYVHPPYFAAWGYPDPRYHHRAWHAYHHGYIRHHHW